MKRNTIVATTIRSTKKPTRTTTKTTRHIQRSGRTETLARFGAKPYRSGNLELSFDRTPALHPGNAIFDALDGDLGSGLDRIPVEAARSYAMP